MNVTVVAEAGVNHNGSLELALRLIDCAADAGADIVKFQTFRTERVVTRTVKQAEYQMRNTGSTESQWAMLKRLEPTEAMHRAIVDHCRQRGIEFMSTPFDEESVSLLAERLGVRRLKIPSGEITNPLLLLRAARTGLPMIISTGMSTLDEVRQALGVVAFGSIFARGERFSREAIQNAMNTPEGQRILKENVTLLHCTTEYPAPFAEVNLKAMDTLRETFGLPVGLSDHTPGVAVAIAAAGRGAVMIEKHITMDRTLPGPDHRASLEPHELKTLVQSVRQVEAALGTGVKIPAPSEVKNIAIARRSLVASKPIKKGEVFRDDNLTVKRPGTGISPMDYWEWLGRPAPRDFQEDELIS